MEEIEALSTGPRIIAFYRQWLLFFGNFLDKIEGSSWKTFLSYFGIHTLIFRP